MVYHEAVMRPTASEPFAMPMSEKKRKLHLSFDDQPPRKKIAAILSSPDVKKLASPALEKFLLRNWDTAAGTPMLTPSTLDLMLPNDKTPTEEERKFVSDFLETLEGVKQRNDPKFAVDVYTNTDDNAVLYGDETATNFAQMDDTNLVPLSNEQSYTCSTDYSGDESVTTCIPVFEEADVKNYTDLSFAQPALETAYIEIPTVSTAPPGSIPLMATKTASIALASGGKLLSINWDLPVATKSEPEVPDNIPTTIINSPTMSNDFDEETFDDSDEDYRPEDEEEKPPTKKSGRKGNTRPIPSDLPAAEKRKLERKRERNRIAATKCRQRKMQKIDELEKKVKQLKGENTDLSKLASKLKKEVAGLKSVILDHVNAGCQIIVAPDFFNNARK